MNILKHTAVKYGLLMCLITIICLGLMEITGQNQTFDNKSPFQIFYVFIGPAIIWFLGMREKRAELGGKITYKQAFIEGFQMSLVFAIVSPFVFAFYYLAVNPGIIDYVRSMLQLSGASDTRVILTDMAIQFVSATIFGSLYAAIVAIFVRTKN